MQRPSPGNVETSTRSEDAKPRFPFPSLPKGWFVVALSDELGPKEILSLHYFGRDLIAFRGESGEAHVVGAYCPHLGAHLAHGGTVEGEHLRCPFHGWEFDGKGRCARIPYADKIPPKAELDSFPVREQDGCIFMFYSPVALEPNEPWPLPALDLEGMTSGKIVHWKALRTHPQEVFENTVDIAHIAPVHDGVDPRVLEGPVRDGPNMSIDLAFTAPGDVVDMPGTFNDVELHVELLGLGHVVVKTHVVTADVRACQRIYATPVDEDCIDMRGIVHVRESEDAEFTAELHEIFYRAYVEDFARDFPIWENKRYLERPSLAKGDGPIGVYRRWCRQFYIDTKPKQAQAGRAGDSVGHEPSASAARARLTPAADLLRRIRPVGERMLGSAGAIVERVPWIGDLVGPLIPTSRVEDEVDADEGAGDDGSSAGASTRSRAATKRASSGGGGSTPTLRVDSAQHYVETLPERFVASAAKGVNAVFQWELSGPGGLTFHARVDDGTLEIVEGAHPSPTTTLAIGTEDYVKVVNGELDGMRVFTSGKGKVKGSIKAAMKMRAIFPA